MDVQKVRPTAPLSLALIMAMLFGTVFAAVPAAEAQATCFNRTVTVNIGAGQVPTSGNDVILGTSGADNINGGGGVDFICGLGGKDTINGGALSDYIDGGSGADRIWGGSSGNDTIYGGTGGDTIYGRSGADTIYGQGGADKIYGEGGADKIYGGNGADQIWGGTGPDLLNGEGSNDTIYGEGSNDTINGGNGTDNVNGGSGNDLCDAEHQSACENPQAPEWTDGFNAVLQLERVSEREFTISWGALHGNADYLKIVVTNSAGEIDPSGTGYGSSGSFTVDDFKGYALDANEEYRVDVTPVNAIGNGATLGLYPISVIRWNATVTDESDGPLEGGFASSPPGIAVYTGYGSNQCGTLKTVAFPEVLRDWNADIDIRFDAWTQYCKEGANFDKNITIVDCDDNNDNTSIVSASESDPPGRFPTSPRLFNHFECSVSGDGTYTGTITAKLSANVSIGGTGGGSEVSSTRTVEQSTFLDANISVFHELVRIPNSDKHCWRATITDSRSGVEQAVPDVCRGHI